MGKGMGGGRGGRRLPSRAPARTVSRIEEVMRQLDQQDLQRALAIGGYKVIAASEDWGDGDDRLLRAALRAYMTVMLTALAGAGHARKRRPDMPSAAVLATPTAMALVNEIDALEPAAQVQALIALTGDLCAREMSAVPDLRERRRRPLAKIVRTLAYDLQVIG